MFKRLLHWGGMGVVVTLGLFLLALVWGILMLTGPESTLSTAERSFWRSHFTEAEDQYRQVIGGAHLPGQRARAYTGLCRLMIYQEKQNEALAACQAAAQMSPDNKDIEIQFARLYTWLGNYEAAQSHARRAMELNPGHSNAPAVLAEALARQEESAGGSDYARALKFAEFALTLDAQDPEALRVRGTIRRLQGNLDEALSDFKEASRLRPEFYAYYIEMGAVENDRGNIGRAFDAFNIALRLAPDSVNALQGRGWTWWASGDYQHARQDFQQAILLNNRTAAAWSGLGWTYLYEGGIEQAQHAFYQALDLNPSDKHARVGLESLQVQIQEAEQKAEAEAQTLPAAPEPTAGAAPPAQTVQGDSPPAASNDTGETLRRSLLAAVEVYAFDANLEIKSSCSGFFVSPQGYLLTNVHCLGDAKSETPYNKDWLAGIGIVTDPRQPPEKRYRARAVHVNFGLDAALLRIIANYDGSTLSDGLNLPWVPAGNSDQLQVGDEVWTAGFPGMGGDTLTITRGVVSGFANQSNLPWIKTDLMTGPGNSGGMVINNRGELVGLHSQVWFDQGQNASRLSAELPVNALKEMLGKMGE